MSSIILITQFVLAVIIAVAVLLQKSSSIGLGAYSSSNESLFGAKGPAGFLAKFTFVVGLLFVLNTLVLGYMYNKDANRSIVDSIEHNATPAVPSTPAAAPSAPAAPTK